MLNPVARTDPMSSTSLPFLRSWSRNPVAVGLPFPSSPWTARSLAHAALEGAIAGGGPLLELGGGTGAVTRALLQAGCPVQDVVVVERDAQLCRTLEKRLPGLQVLEGDALEIGEVLSDAGIPSVCAVICGLPMRAVPPRAAARCYSEAFSLMPPGGTIVQYTYGFRSPVEPDESILKLEATFLGREWRNIPPMAMWRYRLPARQQACGRRTAALLPI
jgi:phosphatidylethanolamine/phosphatidyl-N-methylethanolamine N-methyltransferase